MLRRCKKDRLLFVNEVDDIICLGAGLRSDCRACVELKMERESMLESRNE